MEEIHRHTFTIVPVYLFHHRKNEPIIFQRCHGFIKMLPTPSRSKYTNDLGKTGKASRENEKYEAYFSQTISSKIITRECVFAL